MCFQSSGKLWECLRVPLSLDAKIVQCCLACWHPSEMDWDTGSLRKPNPAFPALPAASFPTSPCVQDSICLCPAALSSPPWFPGISALEESLLRVWATAGGSSAEQQQSPHHRMGIPPFPHPTAWPPAMYAQSGSWGSSPQWTAIKGCELLSQLLLILHPDIPFNPKLCSECAPC